MKSYLQTKFGQNCETITAKKPETRTKVDFLFERANILSETPVRQIGTKSKKNQLFETNLDTN